MEKKIYERSEALYLAIRMFKEKLSYGKQPSLINVEDPVYGNYFIVMPCEDGGIFNYYNLQFEATK